MSLVWREIISDRNPWRSFRLGSSPTHHSVCVCVCMRLCVLNRHSVPVLCPQGVQEKLLHFVCISVCVSLWLWSAVRYEKANYNHKAAFTYLVQTTENMNWINNWLSLWVTDSVADWRQIYIYNFKVFKVLIWSKYKALNVKINFHINIVMSNMLS